MRFFSRNRIHKAVHEGTSVEVSEKNGVRSLHLGSTTVQSAMRLAVPNDLELSYTRSMMAFLLFNPMPDRVLMIGLGGGSLAKFIYSYIPTAHIDVVEIHPQVIAVAHQHFFVPQGDPRLQIHLADGAQYVKECANSADVLIVDGYDGKEQVEALVSETFYTDVHQALGEAGIMVVNLWGSDKRFSTYLKRIESAFDGLNLCLPAENRGNIIVIGFKKSPGSPRWSDLEDHAKKLQSLYGLAFNNFVRDLRKMNLHTEKRLLV